MGCFVKEKSSVEEVLLFSVRSTLYLGKIYVKGDGNGKCLSELGKAQLNSLGFPEFPELLEILQLHKGRQFPEYSELVKILDFPEFPKILEYSVQLKFLEFSAVPDSLYIPNSLYIRISLNYWNIP